MKRAIEESFPIVEINRLAVPERNAFKPIYQMHKWFARRASCVFRAILLGALKPAGTDIMAEFYKDHRKDPDTNGKKILDPFMGGGTTVVEALRLGCEVTGVDLNPVAWFIVKTETEPVDPTALDEAFERLAKRIVPWSGKSIEETLAGLYRTDGPWTPDGPAGGKTDLIYTFWVKSAPCTSPTCGKLVPLFKDFIVAAKKPSVRYHPGCTCPNCGKSFDWEIEPAALVDDPRLMLHSGLYSAGEGRSTNRWTYAHPEGGVAIVQGDDGGGQSRVRVEKVPAGFACCPHCYHTVKPRFAKFASKTKKTSAKPERKKVPIHVLLCPQSEEVFQWRGELPDGEITAPGGNRFNPKTGNMPDKGEFVCSCGNRDSVIAAIRTLPETELLPMHAYAVQAWSPACDPGEEEDAPEDDLFSALVQETPADTTVPKTHNLLWKQSGKFFARHRPSDLALCQQSAKWWVKHKDSLPWPKSEVPEGEKTKSGLLSHHYRYWHQLFSDRQLLALSTLLQGIMEEEDRRCREQLLLCLSGTTDTNNVFTRFMASRDSAGGQTAQGVFARHDFQPKMTVCEQNVWGMDAGGIGSFLRRYWQSKAGVAFAVNTADVKYKEQNGKRVRVEVPADNVYRKERETGGQLFCKSSASVTELPDESQDFVITDPPYSDNVNYSELSDFYYVWLRLLLKQDYPHFLPEIAPKAEEVIKNASRGKSDEDFGKALADVFREANRVLKPDGLMAFTFHHAEDSAWQALLQSIFDSGFMLEAIYPVHSEGESSLHLMDKEAIAYDLIHVCRKRPVEDKPIARSWAGLRQQVRVMAREEVQRIEAGRYGNEPLPAPDVRMVLIGKCLEVYSRHYGQVLDWQGKPMPLVAALQDIRLMVEQVVSRENPLPQELDKIDAKSQVWLMAFSDRTEVTFDAVSKLTRGVFEVNELTDGMPPLLRKGRMKEGRAYKILTPQERLNELVVRFDKARSSQTEMELGLPVEGIGVPGADTLVDLLHVLLGLAAAGERLDTWVERFAPAREPLRAALEFLKQKDPKRWEATCDRLLPYYTDILVMPPSLNQPD